jgi:AcrR family transcriptional regulator
MPDTRSRKKTTDTAVADAHPGWELIGGLIKDGDALQAGRQRLLAGAKECFVRKGYGGTVVGEIAEAAGISIGSFYKYVRSKEDLLWLLAEEVSSKVRTAIETSLNEASDQPLDRLLAAVAALIRVSADNQAITETFYLEYKHMPDMCKQRVREHDANLVSIFTELIKNGLAADGFECKNPRFVAVAIEMMATEWVLKRKLVRLDLGAYVDAQLEVVKLLVGATHIR